MRQIMHYDGEFRREEATPPQSALTRSTDGGSDRLERWGNSTLPPCRTGREVMGGAKKFPQKYRRPQMGA